MKLGFIGCGNMASAIIGGILEKKIVDREDITASTKSEESAAKIKEKLGIACSTDNRETAKHSDMVFLAVKPQFLEGVIAEIKDVLGSDQVIISIAAGKTMSWLEERIGGDRKIIRTMPNTPALVGEGITGVCRNALVEEKELEEALVLMWWELSAEVPRPLFSCSLRPWLTALLLRACRGKKLMNLRHRQFWAVQKWSLRPGCIRASSRIWCAHRQVPLLKGWAFWSKRACAVL